jgi:hypothetical protein
MQSLPSSSLRDLDDRERSFPNGKPALLCFVREECETCHLSMPVIEAVHRAFGSAINVWAIGQEDNAALIKHHKATVPMLDEMALKVSFANKIESYPQSSYPMHPGLKSYAGKAFTKAIGRR